MTNIVTCISPGHADDLRVDPVVVLAEARGGANKRATVSEAIVDALRAMKVQTLAYDNGQEFAGHLEVSRLLVARSYFCAPYHAWEKGLVENHNGLLRQHCPKDSSFEHITAAGLQDVAGEINEMPRKTLEISCPPDYLKHITAV